MKPIIVCEPQCWGFEHVPFNAALLWTVLLAYPGTPIIFWGEAEHLSRVKKLLTDLAPTELARITWQKIPLPPRNSGGWPRLWHELTWIRSLLQILPTAQWVLLCSVTNTAILELKILLTGQKTAVPIIAIPHSILSSLLAPQPIKPWTWLLNLRQLFRLPQPPSLKYLALGDSIYHHLTQAYPYLAPQFVVLDHPYLWSQQNVTPLREDSSAIVRFGYFGVGAKGFDKFAQLAHIIKPKYPQAEFTLVGFLNKAHQFSPYVMGLTSTPLSDEEYQQRAMTITYSIWLADAAHYRLAASASFLDTLSYLKPGIYLRNAYVEHYAQSMGDIGYLCADEASMITVIESIMEQFPTARYQQQCQNILHGRTIFEPITLAPKLRAIIKL